MRLHARMIIMAVSLAPALAACDSGEKAGNVVQLKDMEVVDGTATDAMTDLDGVQGESAAVALPSNGASAPAGNATAAPETPADAEVLADQ